MFDTRDPIYLDYNATTPHAPEVIAAIRPYLEEHFGNPSSSHAYGRKAHEAVETARGQVAALLGAEPGEILFTSGGTESNNAAIRGIALGRRHRGRHIISSQIEHPAVSAVCASLRRDGFEITLLPVDECGMTRLYDLERALRPDTILVTVMHANNEVGTIQPIEEMARLSRSRGIAFHTDAAQSVAKIPTRVREMGVDLLSLAGHKLYAPKGVGALYVRAATEMEPLMHGAGQERGRRPGTENVMAIAGLGKACEIALRDGASQGLHLRRMRDLLEAGLAGLGPHLKVNGHPGQRLPNTLSVSVRGLDAADLLEAVGNRVAASAGAACHSGGVRVSPVLEAMHLPEEWARGTLRFSTGRMTTETDIRTALGVLATEIERLRRHGRA